MASEPLTDESTKNADWKRWVEVVGDARPRWGERAPTWEGVPEDEAPYQEALTMEQSSTSVWYVLRRGRPSAAERVLYKGPDEARARRVFENAKLLMRQGTVRWGETRPGADPWPPVDAQDFSYYSAPMVRTRW